ncbi:MAG: glycosyltransferase family 4 protein, partial [Limisphaerales bacterium]
GAWRAKLWRAKFYYWVMDMNPDEAIAAGWLRKDSAVGKILERMSRFSFRRANGVIALDRFMRDRIIDKGIAPEKIAVIPPGSLDGEVRFDTAGREQFRREHGLEDNFVVMYAGNHSPVHSLDTLMEAAEQLKDDGSVAFCFVGGGSEFRKAEGKKQKAENENWKLKILCLPYQPLGKLSASLSAADAHVVVMGDAFVGLVHPCKIYNILAVGAPVIYIGPSPGHVPEILETLGDHYPQICVRHGEAEILARQIQALQRKKTEDRQPLLNDMTAIYSKSVLLPKLIAKIEETISPEAPAVPPFDGNVV